MFSFALRGDSFSGVVLRLINSHFLGELEYPTYLKNTMLLWSFCFSMTSFLVDIWKCSWYWSWNPVWTSGLSLFSFFSFFFSASFSAQEFNWNPGRKQASAVCLCSCAYVCTFGLVSYRGNFLNGLRMCCFQHLAWLFKIFLEVMCVIFNWCFWDRDLLHKTI